MGESKAKPSGKPQALTGGAGFPHCEWFWALGTVWGSQPCPPNHAGQCRGSNLQPGPREERGGHRSPFSLLDVGTAPALGLELQLCRARGWWLCSATCWGQDAVGPRRMQPWVRNHGHCSGFYFPTQEQAKRSLVLVAQGSAQRKEHGPALWAQRSGSRIPAGSPWLHSHTKLPTASSSIPGATQAAAFPPACPCSLHGCGLLLLHIPSLGVHQLPPDLR